MRRLRYFYNNTRFAGSSFDFHGSPIAILKGRIIAVLLILLINVPFLGLVVIAGVPAGVALAALPFNAIPSVEHHVAQSALRISGRCQRRLLGTLLPIGIVVAAGAVSGLSMLISPFLGMGLLILTMRASMASGPTSSIVCAATTRRAPVPVPANSACILASDSTTWFTSSRSGT